MSSEVMRAAYLNAEVACALIELESMKVDNMERENAGLSYAYGEQAFMDLRERLRQARYCAKNCT